MSTEQLIKDLRDLTATLICLGDLKKAETVSVAADRLVELEAAKEKLTELLGCPAETIEAYLKYEREKSKEGQICHTNRK